MKGDAISEALQRRKAAERYRVLPAENNLIDFCSNDYLGFARSEALRKMVLDEYASFSGKQINGSTGSRLLSGNSKYVQDLEDFIAHYHRAEAALIFNSGYDANTGLLSSVPQPDDIILYDELVHTSLRDGIRLSRAKSFSFRHNDLNHLTSLFQDLSSQYSVLLPTGQAGTTHYYIIVESVYSMDGDFAPLEDICLLCEKNGYQLIIDEAHATGIYGRNGEGRAGELGLEKQVFARIHTFGKALGTFGAAVLGSRTLIDYLINYARPFIYTTALPPILLAGIKCAYSLLPEVSEDVNKIKHLIAVFREKISEAAHIRINGSLSPVQAILVDGNMAVKSMAAAVQRNGYDTRPILFPSVPEGKERIRICIHSFNTEEEINGLVNALENGVKEIQ